MRVQTKSPTSPTNSGSKLFNPQYWKDSKTGNLGVRAHDASGLFRLWIWAYEWKSVILGRKM